MYQDSVHSELHVPAQCTHNTTQCTHNTTPTSTVYTQHYIYQHSVHATLHLPAQCTRNTKFINSVFTILLLLPGDDHSTA